MKDNAANIVAGILIQGEIQRRNDETRREQEETNRRLNDEKEELRKNNETVELKNKNLASYSEDLEYDVDLLQLQNVRLEDKVDKYKKLLCKPMAEIAAQDGNFKETYEKQMELLANWMVSQKAFKELAIQFGAEKGLSPAEVVKMGLEKKIDVLEDKNNPEHKTNVGNSSIILPRVERLKEKYYLEQKK